MTHIQIDRIDGSSPVQVNGKRSVKTAYLGFRLPVEEYQALSEAAAACGETVSEYVRKAIAIRRKGQTTKIPVTRNFNKTDPIGFLTDAVTILTFH